ncbi:MAG: phosphoribosylamine--glycine ligase [bacterium]|nr:phosphoribosylamine--glycine ligase [bacterium]
MSENILIFGQGGREHALAYSLFKSNPMKRKIFVSPGNAGIAREFEFVSLGGNSLKDYIAVAERIRPNLIIVGPEDPLALGVVDALNELGFLVFGPTKKCAQLEASKSFMKTVCFDAYINSAPSQTLTSFTEVDAFFKNRTGKFAVKADGLCAGKGVTVCGNAEQAIFTTKKLLGINRPLFGAASSQVVVEDFLLGQEMSVIGICDGEDAILYAPVRDHKRLLDGNVGPNTGGMGVFGPVLPENEQSKFLSRVKEEVFLPVLHFMKTMGTSCRGFLYAGLMVHNDEISVLEFNVRLGDPEAQALLFGSDFDLFEPCLTVAKGNRLSTLKTDFINITPTTVVVLAAGGYPEFAETGEIIEGLDCFKETDTTHLFYAGVKENAQGRLVTSSGRVLSCAARGKDLIKAKQTCYEALKPVHFANAQFRTDIGS